MDRAIENPLPGIQIVNSNITSQNDVIVSVNNHPDSMLTRLNNSLKPVASAYHDSYEARQRSECFPNTRVQVLSDIEKWVNGESHQAPIYILYGVAGIGKSTVAQTIALRAAALGLLGASFFFSRDEEIRTVARHFFPTIAYQLSCRDNVFATQVSLSLDRNPDTPAKLLNQQLALLLLEPLQKVLSQKGTPTLIVVDALDECDERGAKELLTLLGNHVHQIKGLKILITSRPEVHLRHVLRQDGSHEKFCLHEIEESIVHSDISLYLRFHFSAKAIREAHPDTTWQPTKRDMDMLCGICGTLFIIAATATKFILGSNNSTPQKQLSRFIDGVSTSGFVGSRHNKALDHTYIRILCAALSGDDEIDRDWLRNLNRVLGALICLANPLPCSALALLLEMDSEDIKATLSQLHSLVAPTGNGPDMVFRIHHKSFPDFITNSERIRQALTTRKICPGLDSLLWIDVIDQHLQLAKACYKTMDRSLKRNMANMNEKDWYKDKEDIPHIRPLANLIPRELAYAAMHWASHLRSAQGLNEDLELQSYLDSWASRHILSWMEVMAILDKVNHIYAILQDAIKGLVSATSNPLALEECLIEKLRPEKCAVDKAGTEQKKVMELLLDACRFVQQGGEVMKISPMHIYRSCLTFVPITTSLYKVYSNMAMLRGCVGRRYQWDPLVATLIGHSRSVKSVAFSADGSRVASGSNDSTVRLWDANTGAHLSTLVGHSRWVNSVAFSADGSRVASGSEDYTVRLWDANTGAHLSTLPTFAGHSGWVNSVALSADGSRVASGSNDNTVQLWDANTGAHLSTLTDCSGLVYSVAFSADSSQVASGSNDNTGPLWDANSDAHLAGDSSWVRSVAFSADGSRVASGSEDYTVRLWDANTGAHLSTLTGHSGWVNSVAFSADGSRVASGSSDYTVRLWDANTGAHLSALNDHSGWVNSVSFSADGSRVASGSYDKTVRLWDANTGAHLYTLAGHSNLVNSVAVSADGSRVASGSNDFTVRLWDANTGAHLSTLVGHSRPVYSVAFSADGSRVASGSDDKTVRLWDANTGAHLSTLVGHSRSVNSVAFSADGSRVASGSEDKTVRLWDANTGAHLSTFPTLAGHSGWVNSVAFSADGLRVASGSNDNTIQLWDANTGAHLSTLTDSLGSVYSVAFSADGSRVASGSNDNTIQLWDANTGAPLSGLAGHSGSVNSVVFSADGSRVASGSNDYTVRLWDANTGAHLSTLTGHSGSVNSVAFSVDSSRVASGSNDSTVRLWDANTGAHLSALAGHSSSVNSVAFSADGSRVASGSNDYTVRLWDANTGAHLSALNDHSGRVNSVAFSADGSRVASGSNDSTVRLWDANTGAHLSTLTGHSGSVYSVAFSADGSRVASGSYDKTVRLWDANTGAHLSTLAGHSGLVNSVVFSADGSRVASGSDDYIVRLWDVNTGAHLSTLAGHSGWVYSVAFSADGSRVASGSNDYTVRLWDANTDAHLSTLVGHSDLVNSVTFSADGSRVASGSNDGTVRLWDANTGAHLSTLAGHSSWVNSLAFSVDDSRVDPGSNDDTVRLWEANTGAYPSHIILPGSIKSVLFLPNNSQMIDQVISPGSQALRFSIRDSTSLLLLVEREKPSITGIMMATLVMKEGDDLRWEVIPVCWFPPDISVICFSVDQLKSELAIGCKDGRVMTLNCDSHCSNPHTYS